MKTLDEDKTLIEPFNPTVIDTSTVPNQMQTFQAALDNLEITWILGQHNPRSLESMKVLNKIVKHEIKHINRR